MPAAKNMACVRKSGFVILALLCACRIPEYREIKNLVQVTRYLSATRFDKEFHYRKHWAIGAADAKMPKEAKERWTQMQTAVWDFQSFHQSFYDVTLEQSESDIWEKPLAFLDSKPGKKLARSLDIYYEQARELWRDFRSDDIAPERKRLITELYFLGFDIGLEEDIARLLNPLFTEAEYKVKHGRIPAADDEEFKERAEKNLEKELRRLRRLNRTQNLDKNEFRDLAIRFSLLTDEDLAAILREQSKPENIDMGHFERIAIAESMAFQLEDFLRSPPEPVKE